MTTTRTRSSERAQFLADVLTTALEGGIGYWSAAETYRWYDPKLEGGTAEHEDGIANAYATIVDDDGERHEITLDTIAHGIAKLLMPTTTFYPSGYSDLSEFALSNRTNGEDGDYDAEIADAVVQLGIYGKVVWG
jgi:hypothetical protein